MIDKYGKIEIFVTVWHASLLAYFVADDYFFSIFFYFGEV